MTELFRAPNGLASASGKIQISEIVLQLGWGQPAEAAYKREWQHQAVNISML